MIRRGGEIDGVRILSPRAVELMATNQVGTLYSSSGLGFGYGFQTTDRYGANGMESVGSFGWGGAYGTTYRIDPKAHMVVGDDDSDAAEHERHRGALQRDLVSVAARRANQVTERSRWSARSSLTVLS